jgi:hypothetical protein
MLIMNKVTIIGLLAIALSAPTYATTCVDINVGTQLAIHGASSGPANQQVNSTQNQDPSCEGNVNVTNTTQTSVAADAPNQTIQSNSTQSTPVGQDRLRALGVKNSNVAINVTNQFDITIPDVAAEGLNR